MRLATVAGARIEAQLGLRGTCPGCGGEVYAKCGEVLVWHWAHVTAECDSWTEPESEWHLDWKSRFPEEFQEVSLGEHRADVKGSMAVLEVQRSPIAPEMIREREEFYGEMYWVLKGADFADRFSIWYLGEGDYGWRWKMPRKSWDAAEATVVIDLPYGLFVLGPRDGTGTPWEGSGWFLTSQELYEKICGPDVPLVEHPWHEADAVFQERREQLEVFCARARKLVCDWHDLLHPEYQRRFLNRRDIGIFPSWFRPYASEGDLSRRVTGRVEQALIELAEWESLLADALEFQEQEQIAQEKQAEELARLRALERKQDEQIRRQRVLEEDEREQRRIAEDLQRQAEADNARRRSQEEYEAWLRRRKEEAERAERLELARIRATELLKQTAPLTLEWQRGHLIERFLSYRGAPVGGFGRLETPFIQSCLGSFEAAKARGKGFVESAAPQPLI